MGILQPTQMRDFKYMYSSRQCCSCNAFVFPLSSFCLHPHSQEQPFRLPLPTQNIYKNHPPLVAKNPGLSTSSFSQSLLDFIPLLSQEKNQNLIVIPPILYFLPRVVASCRRRWVSSGGIKINQNVPRSIPLVPLLDSRPRACVYVWVLSFA